MLRVLSSTVATVVTCTSADKLGWSTSSVGPYMQGEMAFGFAQRGQGWPWSLEMAPTRSKSSWVADDLGLGSNVEVVRREQGVCYHVEERRGEERCRARPCVYSLCHLSTKLGNLTSASACAREDRHVGGTRWADASESSRIRNPFGLQYLSACHRVIRDPGYL